MNLLDRPLISRRVGETVSGGGHDDISRLMRPGDFFGRLRTAVGTFRRTFHPTTPGLGVTKVNYSNTRKLYRNDDPRTNLGSGMVRRIVNSRMDFIDLPHPATGDEVIDEFLENCIHTYWPNKLLEMIRDATRDADTVVRIRRHDMGNKLVTPEEWEACYLEIVPPERCSIIYKQTGDKRQIEAAYIRHEIEEIVEETNQNGRALQLPQVRRKVIIEELTPSEFRYFDQTEGIWRNDLKEDNSWGFVPLYEVNNEYDASLDGGQSDLEAPLPFIMALHDVIAQSLVAHKAHSIPKAKFKVNNMTSFLVNNFPDAFENDENGNPDPMKFTGQVNWKGTEIMFFEGDEDADFLEAQSVLGDSATLADFLIGCIAIASETPRSILMASAPDTESEMIPFTKMINRKRKFFTEAIQEICKMVQVINLMPPTRVSMEWEELTPEEALIRAQAFQQEVMAGEVLATRQVISDRTLRAHLRKNVPHMKPDSQEKEDAKSNKELPVVSAGSVSGSDSGANE